MGVGGLGAVADGAEDVGLAGAVLVLVDGVAQGLAVDGQDLVIGAVGVVPALQGAVELGGVDAHQHVADDGLAGHGVKPVGCELLFDTIQVMYGPPGVCNG